MTISTGASIEMRGTPKTLEGSGSSITNGAVVQADDAYYDTVDDGDGAPDGEFALIGTFSTAPTENSVLALYARPMDIDGTADTEVPEAARPTRFIGSFVVNNVTSSQAMQVIGRNLPKRANYYLYNNSTGQTLGSGWSLKVTPLTLGPKA